MKWAGVDYGSKLAGTTVVAWFDGDGIIFQQSIKKKDADRFLRDWAGNHTPDTLYLDAPLSLPGVYTNPAVFDDYFYRDADKQLKAMSPMFLGGLTARAMRLKQTLRSIPCKTIEVYPGHLSKLIGLDPLRYKKDKSYLATATTHLMEQLNAFKLSSPPENWHQFDALLAFYSGYRHQNETSEIYGSEAEGQIIV